MATINPDNIQLEPEWKSALWNEFSQPYFADIKSALLHAKQQGAIIYPPNRMIFHAFDKTPLSKVRVVILGQDPYHGEGQAMGLSFSVPKGIKIPPSLRNIYQELARTMPHFQMPQHGDLTSWTEQGVLLLNASLTVEAGKAGSHAKLGWQYFTDAVIRTISEQKEGVVFMLWGNFAKSKALWIDETKHHILTAVHPSPLAGGKFIGCNHFAIANQILNPPINWQP
ncbi:MAG: uracil-DNA glycosylase [Cardiobacteriaceae bacterium]|nr:uracil-DNA glycosylase [Cardiobacteriaceae bacterium]